MKKAFIQCLFVFLVVLFPRFSDAAALYIDPAFPVLNRGDAVTLSVRLDVDEDSRECINAVDAVITYPPHIEPVDVSIGNSIFRVWVETPTINKEKREITFAGGIPNGYCGRVEGDPRLTNVIAEIIFRSPGLVIGGDGQDRSSAIIALTEQTFAYLNDGQGTKASLKTYPSKITLNDKPGAELVNPWRQSVLDDDIPPEEFDIGEILQFPNGSYYITFNTVDKQTGLDHFEVMEEPLSQFGAFQWGRADAPWIVVENPSVYVLRDQSLNSIIRVKAVDKAGNEYIDTLIPNEAMRTMSPDQLQFVIVGFGALVLIAAILGVLVWLFRRRKKAKRKMMEETVNEENSEVEDGESEEYYDEN